MLSFPANFLIFCIKINKKYYSKYEKLLGFLYCLKEILLFRWQNNIQIRIHFFFRKYGLIQRHICLEIFLPQNNTNLKKLFTHFNKRIQVIGVVVLYSLNNRKKHFRYTERTNCLDKEFLVKLIFQLNKHA